MNKAVLYSHLNKDMKELRCILYIDQDLVYLITRVLDSSDTSATWVPHEQHGCDTCATRTTPVQHEWKIWILITTQVETFFHTNLLAI